MRTLQTITEEWKQQKQRSSQQTTPVSLQAPSTHAEWKLQLVLVELKHTFFAFFVMKHKLHLKKPPGEWKLEVDVNNNSGWMYLYICEGNQAIL